MQSSVVILQSYASLLYEIEIQFDDLLTAADFRSHLRLSLASYFQESQDSHDFESFSSIKPAVTSSDILPHRVANTLASKQCFETSQDLLGDVLLEGQGNFAISKGIPK